MAIFAIVFSASSSNITARLDKIQTLLEDKDKNPQKLTNFITQEGFEQKYPIGFALFHSDGRKTLYYGRLARSGIIFDPSNLKVERKADGFYCLNILPVKIGGRLLDNFKDMCVRQVMHVAQIGDIFIDIEPLASSDEGLAWVIGMKSAAPEQTK
jgi:hypothetical protein